MNKINVVMPVYILNQETLTLTENAIDSLGDVYLIIVDNASTVGLDYLKQMSDVYIRNEENLGYAKAVNEGLKKTNYHLIAISNNDVRVSPQWEEVAREVLADPNVYSVHFRMIPYNELFTYENDTWTSGKERWCSQSFFIVDAKKGLEYFDEDFFNSYCDWEYQLRVRATGRQTAYTNKACYQHEDSFTQKQIPEREENNRKNAELFKSKHGKYAEELFIQMYPDQMKSPWRPFP